MIMGRGAVHHNDRRGQRLLHRRLDFSGCRDRVVHVAREGLGLLRRLREIAQHGRDARRAEPKEVEPDVLEREDAMAA